MGTILSQVVGKLLGAGPVCDSECHHVQCCTSTQRVVDPRWPHPDRPRQISNSSETSVRSFWRKKRRIMTTIYIDSRKRVAGDDSSLIGETIHTQTGAKLSVLKLRVADAFLSTDRGQYLYWIDSALGSLNWATLPVGAYTGDSASGLDLLQLCCGHVRGGDQRGPNCLRREPPRVERLRAAEPIPRHRGATRRAPRPASLSPSTTFWGQVSSTAPCRSTTSSR